MRKRFNILPTYHFEENTNGQIRGAAERGLRDCTIYGNCGKNLVNLDAGIDAKGVLIKNNDGTYKLTKQSTSRFSKIITVRIPANTRFVISYELIEYTGVEKYRPVQMVLKLSDSKSITVSPYNAESTNKKIYSTSWMLENDITAIQLYCEGNSAQPVGSYTVFKNFQIELGDESYSEEIDYESYAEVGDSDTESGKYVLPVIVSGKNLISHPYSMATTTRNGITFTDNGDGTVTANGTATATASFVCKYYNAKTPIVPDKKVYYLSGCPDGGRTSASVWNYRINAQTWKGSSYVYGYSDFGDGTTVDLRNVDFDTLQVQIIINNGASVDNLVFKPQLELGEAATDFEPYTAPKTTKLLLDAPLGPGESISCREKGLLVPELATTDPNITNYITFGSEVKPSSAKFDYYKY